VADGHGSYSGETRFPLILQNVHRYFFFIGLIFNTILTIDAVMAFRLPGDGGIGVSLGTVVLVVNAVLAVALHACRVTPAATCAAATSTSSPAIRSATGSGRSLTP
jgi:hypothetical protein